MPYLKAREVAEPCVELPPLIVLHIVIQPHEGATVIEEDVRGAAARRGLCWLHAETGFK